MKKGFLMLLSVVFAFSLLTGCGSSSSQSSQGSNTSSNSSNNSSSSNSSSNKSSSNNSTDSSSSKKSTKKPAWQTEKITLTYGNWSDDKYISAMLKAFMQKYPNITVKRDKNINGDWTKSLATAASAGKLPDVFAMMNVPNAVQNSWLLDITKLWNQDPDAQKVYPNIAKTGVYHGVRYAAPSFESLYGVYVNKTLFKKYNIPLPKPNWTYEDMISIAKKIAHPQDHIYGLAGPWGDLAFEQTLPFLDNAKLGWDTFDGNAFHYNSPAWIKAYNEKIDLVKSNVDEHMTSDEKQKVFGDKNAWVYEKGNVAMGIDGSWNLAYLPQQMKKDGTGDVEFLPYPGGKAGQRPPVVLDFMGLSSTTKHPEAAYALMKWMSYGRDGWMAQLKVLKQLKMDVPDFPISNYPDVWAQIKKDISIEGLADSIPLLNNAVPDLAKWLPGVMKYSNVESDIISKLNQGKANPADYAKQLQDKMNQLLKQGYANIQ